MNAAATVVLMHAIENFVPTALTGLASRGVCVCVCVMHLMGVRELATFASVTEDKRLFDNFFLDFFSPTHLLYF